jgi:hypothetical protein
LILFKRDKEPVRAGAPIPSFKELRWKGLSETKVIAKHCPVLGLAAFIFLVTFCHCLVTVCPPENLDVTASGRYFYFLQNYY